MDNHDNTATADSAAPHDGSAATQSEAAPDAPAGAPAGAPATTDDGAVRDAPGDAAGGAGSSGVTPPTSLLGRAIAELQEAQRVEHDRLLRLAAEYDNFKKRTRKEQTEAVRRAEDKTILEFLPVIDNLERALSHSDSGKGLLEGVSMVHKQFLSVLERFGIKPFDSVEQLFDPERHEAIQQAASPLPPGTVCQEAQRGYLRGDRLVRPAMVVVSLGPVKTAPAADEDKPREGSGGDGDTPDSGQS